MKTFLTDIWTAIRHNQATAIAGILSVALIVWVYGCQSTTVSPLTGKKVTYSQLQMDAETYVAQRDKRIAAIVAEDKEFQAKTELAITEIERQDEFKNQIFDAIKAYAGTTPAGVVVTPIFGILAGGLFLSNRKKDSIIVTKTNALESVTKTA